jgi:hypothetical protein
MMAVQRHRRLGRLGKRLGRMLVVMTVFIHVRFFESEERRMI